MPIPWLIGAAVVAVVAAVASSSSEKEEKERQEREEREARRRAREEEERIEAEAEARRERARAEQARREARERMRAAEQFARGKAQVLLETYGIRNVSLDEVTDSVINNTARCEEILQKAYADSNVLGNTQNKIAAFECELKEINDLFSVLGHRG